MTSSEAKVIKRLKALLPLKKKVSCQLHGPENIDNLCWLAEFSSE
jgi:hypothetical protein